MHEVLVNRLGGLSLPRKSVVRLNDRPDMTLDVYRGRKTTIQQQYNNTTTKWFVAKYITGRQSFVSEYIARLAGDILGNKSSKNLFLK